MPPSSLALLSRAAPVLLVIALLALALGGLGSPARAQFSAAGGAAAESAAESATRRDGVASYGTRNIYRAGRTVRVGSPVEGDFHAAGSRVVIDAEVRGDATLTGGDVDLRRPVGGDLRAAAGKLVLDAPVGGDLLLVGSELAFERSARIGRDALIAGRSVDIRGEIVGELTVYAQRIAIDGTIGGKVKLVAEEIELLDGARILGTLSYTSPNPIKQSSGAQVRGEVTREEAEKPPAEPQDESLNKRWGLLGVLLWSIGLLLFGTLLFIALPGFTRESARRAWDDAGASLGLGFALLIAIPVGAGVAILTIVGIPLGATLLAVYPVLLLTGYLIGVWSVALRARKAFSDGGGGSRSGQIAWLAGTLALLLLVGAVPFLGWLISAWVMLTGMGGMMLTAWRGRQP
jgi:hypothetical protein